MNKIIAEETTKRIRITEADWDTERDNILSYDHPGCDWLFVQIENCTNSEFGVRYETYSVSNLNNGITDPSYEGDEFPEAICTMF